jgi:hypothetical protein
MAAVVLPYHCIQNSASSILSTAASSSCAVASYGAIIRKIAPAVSKYIVASHLSQKLAFSKDHLPTSYAFIPIGFPGSHMREFLCHLNSTRSDVATNRPRRKSIGLIDLTQEYSIRKRLEKAMLESVDQARSSRFNSALDGGKSSISYSLHLNYENFSMTEAELKALGGFLASNSQVNVLTFESLPMELEHLHILMEAYAKEPVLVDSKLHSIIFYDNRLGDNTDCLEVLVRWIKMIPSVQNVSFIRNSISEEHLPSVAQLITDHKKLRRLSLSWNCIKDASMLADSLGLVGVNNRHSRLAELDLSFNLLDEANSCKLKSAAPLLNKDSFAAQAGEKRVVINLAGNRPI